MSDQPEIEAEAEADAAEDRADPAPAAQGKVVITDLLGIGALGKSAAGKEIAKGFVKAVTFVADPARLYLSGLAKNSTDSRRLIDMARAKAEVQKIEIETEIFLERMKERIISREMDRQINLEKTTEKAIEIADAEFGDHASQAIDDAFFRKWMDGALEASTEELQELWARLLARKPVEGDDKVRYSSLDLLRGLDPELAKTLLSALRYYCIYNVIPAGVPIQGIDTFDLRVLCELGFFEQKMTPSYRLREFELSYDVVLNIGIQESIFLSARGYNLMMALGGQYPWNSILKGSYPEEGEVVEGYMKLIDIAAARMERGVVLTFRTETSDAEGVEVVLGGNAKGERLLPDDVEKSLESKGAIYTTVGLEIVSRVAARDRGATIRLLEKSKPKG